MKFFGFIISFLSDYLVTFFDFIIYFFDSIISIRRDRDVISLLKVRGFSFAKSNGLFLIIKFIGFILISLVSILLFLCFALIINTILDIQMPLLTIDVYIYFEVFIFSFLYFLINIPFYILPFYLAKI